MKTNRILFLGVLAMSMMTHMWMPTQSSNAFAEDAPAVRAKAPETKKEATPNPDQRVLMAINKKAKKKPKNGWFPKLTLGLNTSLVSSDNVPGIDNGITLTFGILVEGGLLLRQNAHEWNSTLKLVHTQTKTPTIEPFIKTADALDLKTSYTYRFKDKWQTGLHVDAEFSTALFDGNLVVNQDTNIRILDFKGNEVGTNTAQKNTPFLLTRAFSPMLLKGKAGVNFSPQDEKFLKLEMAVDAVGQSVIAAGNTVADDAATPTLELKQLRTYAQAGLELDIKMTGSVNKFINYAFVAELMYPIITNVETDLKGFDLLNADLSLKVSFKLAKWASLDYVFQAKLIPLLVEQWQVTNNLVLSVKADLF
ncbi:MAG TPA: hypothetical protein DCE42_10245 [Myxococcales bacterium]|nr:hypothetical protein [Deltaproteobacteria bacterium]MBU51076.1 hypothetical protein [Deltaproteobacteria bacterium]HAA55130.1 hypothetical protein [Myxococcales bacterium]|tara:strand:- start:754 stop:1848 length:1095 start_codon:yes stop_codon:yes gene_type:complete